MESLGYGDDEGSRKAPPPRASVQSSGCDPVFRFLTCPNFAAAFSQKNLHKAGPLRAEDDGEMEQPEELAALQGVARGLPLTQTAWACIFYPTY